MKKMKKKLAICLVLFAITLMKVNSSVFANDTNYFEVADEKIYYNEESEIPLYCEDGTSIIAYYYKCLPTGYVIFNVSKGQIIEFCLDEDIYYLDSNKIYCYLSPTNIDEYVVKDGIQVQSEIDGSSNSTNWTENYISENTFDVAGQNIALASSETKVKISHSTVKYKYNPNGICGSVAAAIVFKYYDNYVDSRFIPSDLDSSNGETLIKALVPYIDGSSPGSTYGDIKYGMTQYMLKQSLIYKAGYIQKTLISSPWDKITSTIGDDLPIIVGLSSEPTYGEHWVVCTGYLISSDTRYVYVNDGWGNTDVCINYNYVDGTVYIH
ncbi:MAG: C39 family peptidase [Lachnospiraceae bacterium]|nr:C39 family peptidase [Lachnospiraceae bacterium]